jgi:hypothetical protein
MVIIKEPEPIELLKYPYPYQAAFAVASDIDSGSILRFRAVHALFCGRGLVKENSPEWHALGLKASWPWFDKNCGGIPGLGLDFGDSFFLVGDATTFGMYRYDSEAARFLEDQQEGSNCAELIRRWIREGQIDCFHAFLHYTRRQVEPLLREFYDWCERENVAKPRVWTNHSTAVAPTGLCPDRLQPYSICRLARLTACKIAGPFFGRKRLPLRYAFVRYQGDKPGSRYYVNDLLAANGLRYVYLNIADTHRDQIALPEQQQNNRATILQPVSMDDGVRYWRFERCYGGPPGRTQGGIYLRDSKDGYDASHLVSESNLEELCRANGTCILCTHWTHFRSLPVADETVARFHLLRRWQEAGKIWVTSTARLLEWTRRRTFLRIDCRRESKRLIVDIDGVDDPIFGLESLDIKDLTGLSVRVRTPEASVTFAINGRALSPEQVHRAGSLFWLHAGVNSKLEPRPWAAADGLAQPRLS